MAYDAHAESCRLIDYGLPDGPCRFSRRTRFLPVAVDVDGDLAVTMFARRGIHGAVWRDTHTLVRRGTGWQLLGGGSGSTDGLLQDRSTSVTGGRWIATGGGSTNRDASRAFPFPPPRFVRYLTARVGADVHVVEIAGRRRIAVPWHGTVCVVWGARRPPRVALLDAHGNKLEQVDIAACAPARRRARNLPRRRAAYGER